MRKFIVVLLLSVVMSGCPMFDKNTVKEAECEFSETTNNVVVTCTAPKAPQPPSE